MRSFLTLLALFAFSLHLLLGCCAHHAHGEEGLPGHQHPGNGYNHIHLPAWLSPATKTCCHHGHDHSHPGQKHEHDSSPTPHVPCADPECVFVAAGQSDSSHLDFVCVDHSASLPVTSDERLREALAPGLNTRDSARNPAISPHLRRHLALSRFLN
jgi:hypothetical protein